MAFFLTNLLDYSYSWPHWMNYWKQNLKMQALMERNLPNSKWRIYLDYPVKIMVLTVASLL